MKVYFGVVTLCASGGCVMQPVELHSAPTPSAQQVAQTRDVQTRVIATPVDGPTPLKVARIFPRKAPSSSKAQAQNQRRFASC